MHTLPRSARWLGLAGLIPFFATIFLAAYGPEELEGFAMAALGTYGAVILSFLGAVHWGLALADPAGRGALGRLLLGVLPALVAWVALLLEPGHSLLALGLGILGTAGVETLANRRGLLPPGYLALRWVLSIGAATCLLAGAWWFWGY
jgi:hypothetical protein